MRTGRPKKDRSLVGITIAILQETKAELEALSLSEARDRSQIARFAIEDGLKVIRSRGLRVKGRITASSSAGNTKAKDAADGAK